MTSDRFRHVISGSIIRLLSTYLTRSSLVFSLTLTTVAFDQSSLRWFGISTCIAIPKGQPSSSVQHSCYSCDTNCRNERAFVAHHPSPILEWAGLVDMSGSKKKEHSSLLGHQSSSKSFLTVRTGRILYYSTTNFTMMTAAAGTATNFNPVVSEDHS